MQMYETLKYQGLLEKIAYNVRNKNMMNDTIGILVTRPDLPTGKEILNSLEYIHFRTGKTINFICQGTGHTDQGQNIPIEKKLLKLMGLNGSSVTRSLHNILKIWKNIQNGSILEKVSFY